MIDALLIYNLMFYTRFFFFLNDFLCVKEINNKERKKEGKFKMWDELYKYYKAHGNIINWINVNLPSQFFFEKFWSVCTFHKGATVFAENVSCSWCTICIFPSHRQKYLPVVEIVYTWTILLESTNFSDIFITTSQIS